jgi:hypothetical protein
MLLNWIALWQHLQHEDRKKRQHPLADPLDGGEWQGLLWVLPLLGGLGRPRKRTERAGRRAPSAGRRPARAEPGQRLSAHGAV